MSIKDQPLRSATRHYRLREAVNASLRQIPVLETLEARRLLSAGPTGLAAESTFPFEVTLTWTDNTSDKTHFIVDRAVDGVNYRRIASLPADATNYTDQELEPNSEYFYRIRAITTTLNSPWARVNGSTMDVVMVAPSSVVAAGASLSQINLSWIDNAIGESHFIIDRSEDGENFRRIASLPADSTSYLDTDLEMSSTYFYRIKAIGTTFNSNWARATGATLAPTPPATPSSFTANPGTTTLTLTWTDDADDEIHFIIDRSTDGVNFVRYASLPADSTSFEDTDVAVGNTYFYRLKAIGTIVNSPWVRTSGQIQPPEPEATPPLIVEDFTSSSALDSFTVIEGTWAVVNGELRITNPDTSWTDHLNNRILHETTVAGNFTLEVDASVPAGPTPWVDFAVIFAYQDPNNFYFYSSNQSNDNGTSGIFVVVDGESTELADISTPIVPGTTYRLRLERSGDDIRAYRDGVLMASATDSTFTSGQIGFGSRSDPSSFSNLIVYGSIAPTPPPVVVTAPVAPSNLVANAVSSSQIALVWTDNSANESGFRVERSTDGGNTWTQIATVAANTKSYSVNGLTASTTYHFRVHAYNSAGNSEFSNVVSATTAAPPVLGERPGAHNTGLTNPNILVASGSITVTKDGTVLENLDVKGRITIQANNVTIRNVRVDARMGSSYCIKVFGGFEGTLIEDTELIGATGAGLVGYGWTARRLNIHHMGADGVNPYGGTTLEYSWIHHLGMGSGSHADGIQQRATKGVVQGAIIRYNYFDMPKGPDGKTYEEDGQLYRSNTAIFLQEDGGKIVGAVIEGNWINGGNYTIHLAGTTDTKIINNRFMRDYQYGLLRTGNSINVVLSGNVWDDTGLPAL